MRLLESAQRRTVRDVDSRQFKGSPGIIAAAGIKLRAMIRKRKQVFSQKSLEAGSSGTHVRLSFRKSLHGDHHIGETPENFRVAAGNRRNQQCFRVLSATIIQINLRQMHTRFHMARQIFDGLLIPPRGPARLGFGNKFSP